MGILSLHNGGTYRVEPLTAPVEFISALEAASQEGVAGVERFLVTAGERPSWRETQYERYDTVVIDLALSTTEEYLLKGFWLSGLMATSMLTGTILVFSRRRRRSSGELEIQAPIEEHDAVSLRHLGWVRRNFLVWLQKENSRSAWITRFVELLVELRLGCSGIVVAKFPRCRLCIWAHHV